MRLSTILFAYAGLLASASAFAPRAFIPRTQTHTALNVAVGDSLPSVNLHKDFPPDMVNIAEYAKGKNLIILGLPGAFTGTWSSVQIPGYLEQQDALKKAGVDEVIIWCVNDAAVMTAWEEDQGTEDTMIQLLGDPAGEFRDALDIEMTDPGPISVGIIGRCKRHAIYVEDGVVKGFYLSEKPDDPAGDADPSNTMPDSIIAGISSD